MATPKAVLLAQTVVALLKDIQANVDTYFTTPRSVGYGLPVDFPVSARPALVVTVSEVSIPIANQPLGSRRKATGRISVWGIVDGPTPEQAEINVHGLMEDVMQVFGQNVQLQGKPTELPSLLYTWPEGYTVDIEASRAAAGGVAVLTVTAQWDWNN